ncbi:MAG: hypothetical protein ABW101_17090 [Candidatus Thiodiazotropha sp.]
MTQFGSNPPKYVKTWEAHDGAVISNPNLVLLRTHPEWRPQPYVSYLWAMPNQDNLCVGIETQVATEHTRNVTEPTRQGYGHPTLTGGGNALYGGELLYKPARGGWLINGASGRFGRSGVPVIHGMRMRQAQKLFLELINLPVVIDEYEVRNG